MVLSSPAVLEIGELKVRSWVLDGQEKIKYHT